MICELMGPARGMAAAALAELRPDVADLERRVVEQQHDGYRLAGVVVGGQASAVAVAGFRVHTNLAWGRHLYVDDLVTRTAFRGQGHGRALMIWMLAQARHDGCDQLTSTAAREPTDTTPTRCTTPRGCASPPTTSPWTSRGTPEPTC